MKKLQILNTNGWTAIMVKTNDGAYIYTENNNYNFHDINVLNEQNELFKNKEFEFDNWEFITNNEIEQMTNVNDSEPAEIYELEEWKNKIAQLNLL